MLCPNCNFGGNLILGRCARCGYNIAGGLASGPLISPARTATMAQTMAQTLINRYTPVRGDVLNQGRYRIMSQVDLPINQQRQGLAWSALDLKSSHRQTLIREVIVPSEIAQAYSRDRVLQTVAQRCDEIGKHPGFPKLLDFFNDQGSTFLIFLPPEGETLSALLKRQGGALPEYMVTEMGHQICGLLNFLTAQHPPLVHGSINPDTIVLSDEGQTVSLIYLPLFPPDPPPMDNPEKGAAAYYAPEQVRGEVSTATDLYSLAVVMHHAATGYDPQARLAMFHPPARRLNSIVTLQLETILSKQLSLSPAQRYTGPVEMQKDLATLLEAYSDMPGNASQFTIAGSDPFRLSSAQLREQSRDTILLNMGVFAAICVLLLLGLLFFVLRS